MYNFKGFIWDSQLKTAMYMYKSEVEQSELCLVHVAGNIDWDYIQAVPHWYHLNRYRPVFYMKPWTTLGIPGFSTSWQSSGWVWVGALQIVHALFGSDVLIPRLSHSSNEMKAWEVYVGSIILCMHNEFVCWANTSKNGLSVYRMSGGLGTVAVTAWFVFWGSS